MYVCKSDSESESESENKSDSDSDNGSGTYSTSLLIKIMSMWANGKPKQEPFSKAGDDTRYCLNNITFLLAIS